MATYSRRNCSGITRTPQRNHNGTIIRFGLQRIYNRIITAGSSQRNYNSVVAMTLRRHRHIKITTASSQTKLRRHYANEITRAFITMKKYKLQQKSGRCTNHTYALFDLLVCTRWATTLASQRHSSQRQHRNGPVKRGSRTASIDHSILTTATQWKCKRRAAEQLVSINLLHIPQSQLLSQYKESRMMVTTSHRQWFAHAPPHHNCIHRKYIIATTINAKGEPHISITLSQRYHSH